MHLKHEYCTGMEGKLRRDQSQMKDIGIMVVLAALMIYYM